MSLLLLVSQGTKGMFILNIGFIGNKEKVKMKQIPIDCQNIWQEKRISGKLLCFS